jgi:Transposase DDE domain
LREVHAVIETGKTLRIVSNDLTSPAEEIADLYKTRWQIELFFFESNGPSKSRNFSASAKMPSASNSPSRSSPSYCCGSLMPHRRLLRARSRSPVSHAQTSCTSRRSTTSPSPNHHRHETAASSSDLPYAETNPI